MTYGLYVIAGWTTLAALLAVGNVGKPRKPTTPGIAAAVVAVCAAEVVFLVIAARHLS